MKRLVALSRGWAFRGQRRQWPLQTSIERFVPPVTTPEEAGTLSEIRRSDSEIRLLRDFQRRAGRYFDSSQHPADELEWLAWMQHFGAPTRLFDFTHSPYVAAYFAFEDAGEGDPTIWAVNVGLLKERAGRLLRNGLPELDQHVKTLKVESEHGEPLRNMVAAMTAATPEERVGFESAVLTNRVQMVLPLEPFRLTERLTIQQGTFLCHGDVNASFLDNLAAMEISTDVLRQFVIPSTQRARALEELRLMNITRATLFPGLEGFAQSFRQRLVEEPSLTRLMREQSLDGPSG